MPKRSAATKRGPMKAMAILIHRNDEPHTRPSSQNALHSLSFNGAPLGLAIAPADRACRCHGTLR